MRVLILGANGMLGRDVEAVGKTTGADVTGWGRKELDVTALARIQDALPEVDWVVNCAAFTRVDDAERERDAAFLVNAEAARHLARACAARDMRLLQVSTDYVFDGRSPKPYEEEDATHPLNAYGASKWEGEVAIREEGPFHVIARTQSLFGLHGPNFVRAIARKLLESDAPLRVVADQVSAPTYTRHLAEALWALMRAEREGTVHVTASGYCSWHEFACAIADRIKPGREVIPITTAESGRPAPRPMHSVLCCARLKEWTGHVMPAWEQGLDAYLKEETFE